MCGCLVLIVWVWFLFLVNLFQVSRSLESSVLLKVQDTVVALGAEATSLWRHPGAITL